MGLFDTLRGTRTTDSPRVAFVGIDGVPYDLVMDHPDVFENLHAIAEAGSGGQLSSIVPPESSACWPSLTTGANPGKTGVYGFQDRKQDSYETYIPMGRDVKATRIWDRIQSADRSATVLNVPVTYPPQRSVHRMVSGFLSPSVSEAAGDESVHSVLEAHDYQVDAEAALGHEDDKEPFIESAHATLDARRNVFEHYLTANDWDLFFGVFMTPDRINHFLFGDYVDEGEYADAFLDFYRTLDDHLGALRDAVPDDVTFVVASDHGFTKLEYDVSLNQWLADNGWLSYRDADHDSLSDIATETRAYSFGPGRLYLNLEGREPGGSVPADEYESVRSELRDALDSLVGPDGRKVCRTVVEGESAFSGPHTDIAPDLVALPADGYDLKGGFGEKSGVFTRGPRNGMHTFDNACLFTDAPLRREPSDILDIAPTVLSLLDVDYPASELDGVSLAAE